MKTTTIYKTSDGQEYTSEKDALRHEVLREMKEKYQSARTAYAKALWETQKTADGKPFELGAFHRYYYITPGYFSKPSLREVSFYIWSMELDERDNLTILYKEQKDDHETQWNIYKINELYTSRVQAEYVLVDRLREWLQEKTEEVTEYIHKTLPQIKSDA